MRTGMVTVNLDRNDRTPDLLSDWHIGQSLRANDWIPTRIKPERALERWRRGYILVRNQGLDPSFKVP